MRDTMTVLYHFYHARKLMRRFTCRDDLEQWQNKQLRHFFQTTLTQSPFYKNYTNKPLHALPIMNKQGMYDAFNTINTVGIKREEALFIAQRAEQERNFSPMIGSITVGLSSGTSGKQSIFLASRKERLTWAGIMLAKALPGRLLQKQTIAFFLRANSNLYTTLEQGKTISFRFFDLTQDIEQHLDHLAIYKPTILTAPASVLRYIARAQEEGRINIAPKRIFSVAEVLDPFDESYIAQIFGQPVYQIYQCSEGFLGITHTDGKLYLNEAYLHIEKEWIDNEKRRFVPIITDFTRTTQPIIRYRLDDVLVEDVDHTTVFTCIKNIEGRCDDICYLPTNKKGTLKPLFADSLRQIMATSLMEYYEYKIIQHTPELFEIQLLPFPSEGIKHTITQAIRKRCIESGYKGPSIVFASYEATPLHHKLKRIERRFALSEAFTKEAA